MMGVSGMKKLEWDIREIIIDTCSLIKRHIGPPDVEEDGTCRGYGYDEPCDICKECPANTYFMDDKESE